MLQKFLHSTSCSFPQAHGLTSSALQAVVITSAASTSKSLKHVASEGRPSPRIEPSVHGFEKQRTSSTVLTSSGRDMLSSISFFVTSKHLQVAAFRQKSFLAQKVLNSPYATEKDEGKIIVVCVSISENESKTSNVKFTETHLSQV